jgi:hypothetical protein
MKLGRPLGVRLEPAILLFVLVGITSLIASAVWGLSFLLER